MVSLELSSPGLVDNTRDLAAHDVGILTLGWDLAVD